MISNVIGMVSWKSGRGHTMEDLDSPKRQRVAVGFVVSPETAALLIEKFPVDRRRGWQNRFGTMPILVDPAAAERTCLAVYEPSDWEMHLVRVYLVKANAA